MNKPKMEPEIERLMLLACAQDIRRNVEKHSGEIFAALLVLLAELTNDTGHREDAISIGKGAMAKVLGPDIDVLLVQISGLEKE